MNAEDSKKQIAELIRSKVDELNALIEEAGKHNLMVEVVDKSGGHRLSPLNDKQQLILRIHELIKY